MGTPRKITDQAGNLVWQWQDKPFGDSPVNQDPDGDGIAFVYNLRFPGQYYDAETGLHYNYFRYYDPQTGRYITSDPIGLKGGLDTYAYVGNNPVNLIDPLGLSGRTKGIRWPSSPFFPNPTEVLERASKMQKAWGQFCENIKGMFNEASDDLIIDDKIRKQMGERGWTEQDIQDAIKGEASGESVDKRSPSKTEDGLGRNDPATVYGTQTDYVVINDRTGEVVQVSDKNNPNWIPDGRINWIK